MGSNPVNTVSFLVKLYRILSNFFGSGQVGPGSGQTVLYPVKLLRNLSNFPDFKLLLTSWVHIRSNCSRQIGSTSGQIVLVKLGPHPVKLF